MIALGLNPLILYTRSPAVPENRPFHLHPIVDSP